MLTETDHGMPLDQETLDRVVRVQLSMEQVFWTTVHCMGRLVERVQAIEQAAGLYSPPPPPPPYLILVERAPDDGAPELEPAPKRAGTRPHLRLIVSPQEAKHAT